LDERWTIGDVALIALFFGAAAVGTPMLALLEGGRTGALLVLAPLVVVLGYESGIVPQLKWEIARRLRGD
jgi:hypothetical protein